MFSLSTELFEFIFVNSIPVDELIRMEEVFYTSLQQFWREHNYLTWKWWLLVILSILSPFVWWYLVDKKRILEITAYGLFYGVIAITLDSIGSNLLLWVYPVRLSPYLYPQLYPYDIGVVIIPFMIIYQHLGHSFKKFSLIAGLQSAFIAFLAEPFMSAFDLYHEITWKNSYSFPIYWLIAIICWFVITQFKKMEQR